MVVIRLSRHGAHKAPYYRVVVADRRKRRDGAIIEQVGTYDPRLEPSGINLDVEKIESWIEKGAQPSARVAKLLAILKGKDLPKDIAHRAELKAKQKVEKEAAEKKAAEQEAKRKAAEEAAAAKEAQDAEADEAADEQATEE